MTKTTLLVCIATLLYGCSKNEPDIYLSCSGNSKSIILMLGKVSEHIEPKISSFSARNLKGVKHWNRDATPYHVSIDDFSIDVNSVNTTDFFITGKYSKKAENTIKQEENFNFELNRKTGVLRYTSEIVKTPPDRNYLINATTIFEGNCTRLEGKI